MSTNSKSSTTRKTLSNICATALRNIIWAARPRKQGKFCRKLPKRGHRFPSCTLVPFVVIVFDAMPESTLYSITDPTAFSGDEPPRRRHLLEKIAEAARGGINYIQLREKDLPTRDLESLAREAIEILTQLRTENRDLRTALLINSRADVALAVAADG